MNTLIILFTIGNKENKKKNPSQAEGMATTGGVVISKDELRDIRQKTEKGLKSDAIVISKSELERMKESTKI